MEDLDPEENILSGKQQKVWKPYRDDLGIPALDSLFVMESESTEGSSDVDDDNNDEPLESGNDERGVPAETGDVKMEEVVDAEA